MEHKLIHDLWYREVQYFIHKDSSTIPILSRTNLIPRIDTYFFKIQSNIVLLGLPRGLFTVALTDYFLTVV